MVCSAMVSSNIRRKNKRQNTDFIDYQIHKKLRLEEEGVVVGCSIQVPRWALGGSKVRYLDFHLGNTTQDLMSIAHWIILVKLQKNLNMECASFGVTGEVQLIAITICKGKYLGG